MRFTKKELISGILLCLVIGIILTAFLLSQKNHPAVKIENPLSISSATPSPSASFSEAVPTPWPTMPDSLKSMAPSEIVVFRFPSDPYFHAFPDCEGRDPYSSEVISMQDAFDQGLEPCPVCQPYLPEDP